MLVMFGHDPSDSGLNCLYANVHRPIEWNYSCNVRIVNDIVFWKDSLPVEVNMKEEGIMIVFVKNRTFTFQKSNLCG